MEIVFYCTKSSRMSRMLVVENTFPDHQVMSDDIDDIQDPRFHMSRRTCFYPARGFAWTWMALRARNSSTWLLASSNPRARATHLGQGPHLRRGNRTGSLRAPEPRAPENTRGRKRKKCRCAKKTCLYIVIQGSPSCSGMFPAGWRKLACINRLPAVLVAWGSFLTNATFEDKLALCHIFFKTRFSVTNRDVILSWLRQKKLYMLTIDTNITSRFWRNCHVAWHVFLICR